VEQSSLLPRLRCLPDGVVGGQHPAQQRDQRPLLRGGQRFEEPLLRLLRDRPEPVEQGSTRGSQRDPMAASIVRVLVRVTRSRSAGHRRAYVADPDGNWLALVDAH
jgi:hypothetical protein